MFDLAIIALVTRSWHRLEQVHYHVYPRLPSGYFSESEKYTISMVLSHVQIGFIFVFLFFSSSIRSSPPKSMFSTSGSLEPLKPQKASR